jgi:hypothetical protein
LYPFWLQRTEFGVKQWQNHGETAQQSSAKHLELITGAAKKTQENPGIFPNPLTNPRGTGENFLASTKKPSHLKRLRGPQSCGCFPRRRISFLRIAGAIGDGLGTCFPSRNSLGQAVKSWVLDNPDGTVHWFLEIPMVPK